MGQPGQEQSGQVSWKKLAGTGQLGTRKGSGGQSRTGSHPYKRKCDYNWYVPVVLIGITVIIQHLFIFCMNGGPVLTHIIRAVKMITDTDSQNIRISADPVHYPTCRRCCRTSTTLSPHYFAKNGIERNGRI